VRKGVFLFKQSTNYFFHFLFKNKILLNTTDVSIIHHLLMYECDSTTAFNDTDLPADLCDNIWMELLNCSMNIATGWAVGGDIVCIRKFQFKTTFSIDSFR